MEILLAISLIINIWNAMEPEKEPPPMCLINVGTNEQPVQRWVDCSKVPSGMIVLEIID